ncbi:39S ribosomal protein L50, mitochondrial-like [Amphibalanus amphitrite]|uniref:39S ribosomal protein L50, mitochondrial-like n=1 Tax=Amphibalanus amphitrite TaxID=1232801 RepID=UPI001C91639A|nr:39S ribosomal protein L50, mitochondrial-like [Amphibalanus amphitrite]
MSELDTTCGKCEEFCLIYSEGFPENDLPAVQVKGIEAQVPKDDQRFPETLFWPDELKWANTNSHRRPSRPYQPPVDVHSQLSEVFRAVLGPAAGAHTAVGDLAAKHRLLTACADRLGHHVTNSQLHNITTLGDVISYYSEPVTTSTPLEQLSEQELPKNIHVQLEYLRFHPETDTKFGGVTAFPKSSTVVSSIKYKKKYRGYATPKSWPYK